MPETEMELISKVWLQSELRSATKNLILLDCRSSNEFQEGRIRSAVNFSIPSIMLRRLAAGKIDLTSTIKCRDLKQRIQNAYSDSIFILYNDNVDFQQNYCTSTTNSCSNINTTTQLLSQPTTTTTSSSSSTSLSSPASSLLLTNASTQNNMMMMMMPTPITTTTTTSSNCDATTINVLHRRLKQDGCRVYCLEDGFSNFRDKFPEWCEEDGTNGDTQMHRGVGATEQLMGLRSLRISSPHSDSACSSSAESSDCEGSSITHPQLSEAPVEILPGLFLGNASHSGDSRALQKYNIKYVLNVTPDLPNVFEGSGGISYLQIPITDHWSQDLAVHFPSAINFIDEARTKGSAVLVHCLAGVSRSVTVTLAYLMHTRALCLNDAFALVRQRKPDVSPNFHFMEQLHSYEGELRKINPNRVPLSSLTDLGSGISGSGSGVNIHGIGGHNHNLINRNNTGVGGGGGGVGGGGGQNLTPDCEHFPSTRPSKYSCACLEVECKCMMQQTLPTDYLGTGIGVSPDSGIEFDRWTPADGTPK